VESTERKPRGKRGQGCIYLPKGSRNYWIKFSVNGRTIQQSAETESRRDALDKLKIEILKHSNGEGSSPKIHRITVAELFAAVLTDYRNNGKTIEWAERVWKLHLEPFFGHMRAGNVGTDQLSAYIAKRKAEKEPAANGTINRELALLRRAFTLGYKSRPRKVANLLDLSEHMLEENNVRTGFVSETQYRALTEKVTGQLWLRAMLALGYTYGFRKAELLNMKVGQVDLFARTIRLNPGETKNGQGRTVTLTEECYLLVLELVKGKEPDDPLLTRANGGPVRDFRGAWDALTEAAKLPGLLFHDLRRSAVRNMVRRGVTERVAMRISGHKSRSVFDRYDIVSESDLADAALKVERGGKAELARASEISQSQAKVAEIHGIDGNAEGVQNETVQ
jgi:integrase